MSLRSLMVYRFIEDNKQEGRNLSLSLLFSRRYPSVERRSFLTMGQDYVKMPLEYEYFGSRILDVILNDSDRFVLKSKLEINRLNAPIYEVPLDEVCVGAVLWPVVIIQQGDLLACSVPLIDRKIESANESYFLPSVVAAYELLTSIMSFVAPFAADKATLSSKLDNDVSSFLSQNCPFGTPSSTNIPLSLKIDQFVYPSHLNAKTKKSPILDEKMAAWRPFVTSGKNTVVFTLVEKYNAEMHSEVCDGNGQGIVSGSLNAICDLNGILPEIEFELKSSKSIFESVLVHTSVKQHESFLNNEIKFNVCPPVETFTVVNYNLPEILVTSNPLIKCNYTVKWAARDRGARIKFEVVSVNPVMQSAKLEFLEVQFPFANMETFVREVNNVKLSCGSYVISKKAKRFIWTIGRVPSITPSKPCVCSFFIRFSSRAAQGSTFDSQSMLSESLLDESLVSNFDNEKLSNIYAQVAFKINNFSVSDAVVQRVNLLTEGNNSKKLKFDFNSTVSSGDVKVWNSSGAVPPLCQIPELDPPQSRSGSLLNM